MRFPVSVATSKTPPVRCRKGNIRPLSASLLPALVNGQLEQGPPLNLEALPVGLHRDRLEIYLVRIVALCESFGHLAELRLPTLPLERRLP